MLLTADSSLVVLWRSFLLAVVAMVLVSPSHHAGAARPLNAIHSAVGEWEVSMRGGWWMDASQIFPSSTVDDTGVRNRTKQLKRSSLSPFQVKRRPWGSSLLCSLSLASDGSFVLVPKTKNMEGNRAIVEGSTAILPVRGHWSVHANPYCITDRFYDVVSLMSYPREKVVATVGGVDRGSNHNNVVQTVELNLYCRLWGRHTRQSPGIFRGLKGRSYKQLQEQHQKPGTIQTADAVSTASTSSFTEFGRMTHGTLMWKELFPPSCPWWKRMKPRPVLASFSARRYSREPSHEGWFDKELYGY